MEMTTGESIKSLIDEFDGRFTPEELAGIVAINLSEYDGSNPEVIAKVCFMMARILNDDGAGQSYKSIASMFKDISDKMMTFDDAKPSEH
jgi:hypothetical protein